jgi:pimeloyl-ACP methyl ester carboxylesterase
VRTERIPGESCGLAVHDWGGDGPPVLLAHPTGFHGIVWRPVAGRLRAAGRRVWSFDFRGHGDADQCGTYDWSEFAADVLAVVEHLGIAGDPALVACGHSKGGAALLLAQARRPGMFSRIWTYEPIIFSPEMSGPDDDPLARSARKRRDVWASRAEAFDAYASKPPLDVLDPDALHAYVDYGLRERDDGAFELKCRPDVEASVYTMAPRNGVWNVLPAIDVPVVVACGETSRAMGPELSARVAERLPQGRLEVWPGAGHFGPLEDPDACVRSITRL